MGASTRAFGFALLLGLAGSPAAGKNNGSSRNPASPNRNPTPLPIAMRSIKDGFSNMIFLQPDVDRMIHRGDTSGFL